MRSPLRLKAEEFELLVGEIFRQDGFEVEKTDRREGAKEDLVLLRDGRRTLVHCKQWRHRSVGIAEIREFACSLMREDLPGRAGIIVTPSRFTSPAKLQASNIGLTLVNGHDLEERRQRVRRSEPCRDCGEPVILNLSPRGRWNQDAAHHCNAHDEP
jgi:restriction system protein